jgi:hypothetical protein
MSPLRIENDVVIGADGELYLGNGDHRCLDYTTGVLALGDEAAGVFADNLTARRAFAQTIGAAFLQLVAPDKHNVMVEAYPVTGFTGHADTIAARGVAEFLYPRAALRSLPHRPYYRTDTHWTPMGAAAVARAVAEAFGLDGGPVAAAYADLLSRMERLAKPMVGDLGGKLSPPPEEQAFKARHRWRTIAFNNGVRRNIGKTVLVYSNAETARGRLLIFGDSFILTQLAPWTGFFSEILVCRSPHLHHEIAWGFQPDYILCETAERYLASPTPDQAAPPYLMTFGDVASPADYGPGAQDAIGRALTGRSAAVRAGLVWPT